MGDPVIRNVSFTVPSCSITAVVGPSGSGKSTIAKLLMRLYLPQSGTIELDGVEISRITISDLRRQVRYVGPDAFLFSGTLRDNLLLGGSGAGEDSMRAALSAVGLSWLTELPGYLDVAVGEHGAGFSAGQKQQLAIAQALLSRPRVLILDEATSHLDAGAEEAVLRHLHTLRDCTTVIVIGHAVPHALDVDQVLTVRAGTVVLETDLPAGELKYEG
jgi:ABC-type multidrug transport system fused ATPase/permease subunit